MKNLLEVSNIMFRYKDKWVTITKEEKETFFFIFNRYFSKKYPNESFLLNNKNIDKEMSMDLWFSFMFNKPYPKWFWGKSKKKKEKSLFSKEDIYKVKKKHNLKDSDINQMIKHYPDELREEINYIKKQS